jgi:hypothetical protein
MYKKESPSIPVTLRMPTLVFLMFRFSTQRALEAASEAKVQREKLQHLREKEAEDEAEAAQRRGSVLQAAGKRGYTLWCACTRAQCFYTVWCACTVLYTLWCACTVL